MEQVEIFEVTVFDHIYVEVISDLLNQLTTSPVKFTQADLNAMIDCNGSHLFLLSFEREIAGMLTIGSYVTPTGKKYWIEDVVVDQKFRGKALGHKLIEHSIEYIKSLGGTVIMLTSNPKRLAANQLYQSVGFEQKQTNVYKMELPK